MQYITRVVNDMTIFHGKISMRAIDNEGLIPISGQYDVYFGIIDPLGDVLADINELAGVFGASGSGNQLYDMNVIDNSFIPGVYVLTIIIRDGVTISASRTIQIDYTPHTVANGTGLLSNNSIINDSIEYDCKTKYLTTTSSVDNSLWTVSLDQIGVTPPSDAVTPSPVEVTGGAPMVYEFLFDGDYRVNHVINRTQLSTSNVEDVEWNVTIDEVLVTVHIVTINCAKYCDLATCLESLYNEANIDACANGSWEDLSPQVRGKVLKSLTESMLFVLYDKCGNNAKASSFFTTTGAPDCGCGC